MTNHYQKHKQRLRESASKDFITTESGYKAYEVKPGYLTSDDLRIIADYLDELNQDWDEQVKRDLGNE